MLVKLKAKKTLHMALVKKPTITFQQECEHLIRTTATNW